MKTRKGAPANLQSLRVVNEDDAAKGYIHARATPIECVIADSKRAERQTLDYALWNSVPPSRVQKSFQIEG